MMIKKMSDKKKYHSSIIDLIVKRADWSKKFRCKIFEVYLLTKAEAGLGLLQHPR